MSNLRTKVTLAASIWLAAMQAARGQELPNPTGNVLLTVTGNVMVTNFVEAAEFDYEMLQAIGEVNVTAIAPWDTELHSFTGVPLARLVDKLGVTDGKLQLTSLDGNVESIHVTDLVHGGPIIAYLHNGKIPQSTHGPLLVIRPYDENVTSGAETMHVVSVQLVEIEVSAN